MNNSSVLGRLLEELSWVGTTIRNYREGGRGFENVLTAEALQGLDFLPRNHFLGEVIRSSVGADRARQQLSREIETAAFMLLPGNHCLNAGNGTAEPSLYVQPDGLISTPSTYALIEAKRIRSSSFQTEQLAREFVLVLRDAGQHRQPLLWLLLGTPPPVKVKRHGTLDPREAIDLYLRMVLERSQDHEISYQEALGQVDDVVCWITWQQLSLVVQKQLDSFVFPNETIRGSVERLAQSVISAIEWHS